MDNQKILEIAHRTAWKYKHSSDPNHSATYTFNAHTMIDFARKVHEALLEADNTTHHWQPIATAPKDKPILLDIGMGWPVVGIYNQPSEKWVCAELQMGLYEGEYNDTYFENDHFSTPERWQPLPEITK